MAERELSFIPDFGQGQGRNYKERPTPHPNTLRFLNDARVNGAFYSLSEETRQLIDVYYYSDAGLKDLRGLVHPKTGAQVKSVIFQALKDIWEKLPSEVRERNPLDDVLKLKHQSYSPLMVSKALLVSTASTAPPTRNVSSQIVSIIWILSDSIRLI